MGRSGSWEVNFIANTATWSDNLFRIYGLEPGELSGVDLENTFQSLLHPDDMEHVRTVYAEALYGKRPYDLEYRIVTKDGNIRNMYAVAEIVRDSHGQAARVIGNVQDITERKQTEDQLTRQRDVMKTVIDNFPGAISLFDADLRMAACNAQFKTLLELPAQLFEKPDVHFEDLIRFNAQRGEYGPGDVEALTAASMARARNFQAHHIERSRPGGQWMEITGT